MTDARRKTVSTTWLTLALSEIFDEAACRRPPVGVAHIAWSLLWTRPATREDVVVAKKKCRGCPALLHCRQLVDLLPEPPSGVVQAGMEFGCGPKALAEAWAS